MKSYRYCLSTCLVTGLALVLTEPAFAQSDASASGDIIVTARRSEERLQDVPISITVLSQDTITNRNITNAAELGAYVPSLSTNSSFGPEKSSFVIRGFTQEGKTSPSVGVYFADVVAPRSFGGTTSGNGAGVGSLFDLQNLQVLKGPQGTLFGRNTTGGAILLVPQKPTDRLEGYVEGSLGSYDLRRAQAVLNVPLSDTFRVRVGIDRNKRDGYIHNVSGIGPDRLGTSNYFAARLSIVADLTPDLENYTIFSYSRSRTTGDTPKIMACKNPDGSAPAGFLPSIFGGLICAQIARVEAAGKGYWSLENSNPDPFLRIKQWQAINTTTWRASDSLTVKNIASYGEYREAASFSLFGENLLLPNGQRFAKGIELFPGRSGFNSAQSTMTEELQFQGNAAGGRLTWQAGAYLEISKPLRFNSGLTGIFINCADVRSFNCTNLVLGPGFSLGSISGSNVKTTFNNKGLYAQATYDLTERLSLTGGVRYTIDKMSDLSQNLNINVPTPGTGVTSCQNRIVFNGGNTSIPLIVTDPSQCNLKFRKKWQKPTWLIDLDYKPNADMLLYLKWARGYRQGSINSNNVGIETVNPESVDTFEAGAKTSFRGAVPGYFNVAGFYNKFRDQQLAVNTVVAPNFIGIIPNAQPIVNAGKSRIWGIEADASISPFAGLKIDVAYAYLNTKLQSFVAPPRPIYYSELIPTAQVGQALALSPKNRVTVSGTYTLPLDESVGRISFGATLTHTDANRAVSPLASPNFFKLKETNLVNLNASWESILGSPLDLSFFMTNATNEKRILAPSTSLATIGGEGGHLNMPRMWGFRLRYSFGGE